MIHAERILGGVAVATGGDTEAPFSREQVRSRLTLNPEEWSSGYTAIFQAMRSDHPGGAPQVSEKFRGVFQRISHGKYVLTEKGKSMIATYAQTSAPSTGFGDTETAQKAKAIYERDIRFKLEPDHIGKFLVIDVDTGEWDMDADDFAASLRMYHKKPEGRRYAVRIGYRAAGTFRGYNVRL